MSLGARDFIRLAKALTVTKAKADLEETIPPTAKLVEAAKRAASDPGNFEDNLAKEFGQTIRPGIDMLKQTIVELYGQEYLDSLWKNLAKAPPES